MIEFPASTYVGKRITKKKFYDKVDVRPETRACFAKQVSTIIWRNKLSPATMNIEQGDRVIELEVFEIRINTNEINEDVLKLIDSEIPYPILFLLLHKEKIQAWISYKEQKCGGDGSSKIMAVYHTPWVTEDILDLHITGLNTDKVYESFIRQIAGNSLPQIEGQSLQACIEVQKQDEKLMKEITRLEKLARAERQPKKKFELVQQIRKLKTEVSNI